MIPKLSPHPRPGDDYDDNDDELIEENEAMAMIEHSSLSCLSSSSSSSILGTSSDDDGPLASNRSARFARKQPMTRYTAAAIVANSSAASEVTNVDVRRDRSVEGYESTTENDALDLGPWEQFPYPVLESILAESPDGLHPIIDSLTSSHNTAIDLECALRRVQHAPDDDEDVGEIPVIDVLAYANSATKYKSIDRHDDVQPVRSQVYRIHASRFDPDNVLWLESVLYLFEMRFVLVELDEPLLSRNASGLIVYPELWCAVRDSNHPSINFEASIIALVASEDAQDQDLVLVGIRPTSNDWSCYGQYGNYSFELHSSSGSHNVLLGSYSVLVLPCYQTLPLKSLCCVDSTDGEPIEGSAVTVFDVQGNVVGYARPSDTRSAVHHLAQMWNTLPDGMYILLVAPTINSTLMPRSLLVLNVFSIVKMVKELETLKLRGSARVCLSPQLNANSFRICLTWKRHPTDLRLHVISSNNIHVCSMTPKSEVSSSQNHSGSECDIELETESVNGWGPSTIVINRYLPGVIYLVYVEHFRAQDACYQQRAYHGHHIGSSGGSIQVWSASGLVIESLTVPPMDGRPNTFWWSALLLDGSNGRIEVLNHLVDRQPTSAALRRLVRKRQ